MVRRLVIVSRQHPDLYVYLRDRFGGSATLEMILDRRLAERRLDTAPATVERRRHARRSRPGVDAWLGSRSHVIVILP